MGCNFPCMNLRAYLDLHDLTLERFGKLVGCNGSTVWRIAAGRHVPKANLLRRIVEATEGAVTLQDLVLLGDVHVPSAGGPMPPTAARPGVAA